MRKLWRLELLAYWLERAKEDAGEWLPFLRLVAVTLALEAVTFLYIAGAFRPLSAL